MRLRYFAIFFAIATLSGQAPPKPAVKPVAKPAIATVDPLIDSVIQLKRAGMGDDLIVKGILKEKRALTLGVPEMKLLKAAGVSDRVIGVLMDPDFAAPAPAPPAVVISAPSPPPVPATGPVKRRLAI